MFRCLIRHPAGLVQALAYLSSLKETPPLQRAKLMALIGSAAHLVEACDTAGIQHVHIHSCANAAHLGALAYRLGRIRYSLTLHGDLPVYGVDHKAKMEQAQFVSAVTRPLQKTLTDQIDQAGRFPVIWMGVDTNRFVPQPTAAAPRPPGTLRVLSVARLNRTKGHRFFLRAMAQLRAEGVDVHYLIAGDGPEKAAIQAEIDQLDLAAHVTMLGPVSEDRVLDLLRDADALALTSIGQGEAAPVAVMEAMACGVPPVCSVIGGTPDMITHGKDGFLVAQEDVDEIAEAVRQLAQSPDLRDQMGRAARDTALKLFDHTASALALYQEMTRRSDALMPPPA